VPGAGLAAGPGEVPSWGVTSSSLSPGPAALDRYTLTFAAHQLAGRTFLLGDRGGFVLYLPAARNVRDRTLQSSKWFGASGFGRSFFEGLTVWVDTEGGREPLNRDNQSAFVMRLDGATRVYRVQGREIRETFFVPDGFQAFVITYETDLPLTLKPEVDMRYYQEFNADFSRYQAVETPNGLLVSNRVEGAGPMKVDLQFYGLIGASAGTPAIEMAPEDRRLVAKTYLKDEEREKLITSVYREVQDSWADEAPIWDVYGTKVYAPAIVHLQGPASLICVFGDTEDEVMDGFERLHGNLAALMEQKRETVARQLEQGLLETGNNEVDTAYAHVLSRFNDALVARDAVLHVEPVHRDHYDAIFAGNKYFMDAWKRDENISLACLLVTNDFETARDILRDTWQHQDERTGRLPHIIRAGEPLVYYSSDGTLWALQRLHEYTRASGDESLLREKLPMVERFFSASMGFVQRGLLASGGIIDKAYLWETWEDTPYTPRDGYPAEIELLWLSVLSAFLPVIRPVNGALADRMAGALAEGRETFKAFSHDGYLVDSLSYQWEQRRILTPNGYIAFGLGYPLPPELQRSMVLQARDQLAGHRGVRSLAPRDWPQVLPASFLNDPHSHRGKDMASVGIFNYHRGIEWEWLNPFFVQGELTCGDPEDAYRLYVRGLVTEALGEMGIGGLSELYDIRGPLGADFQAWSMAGFVESLHLFAGVEVDAPANSVRISPALPSSWPYLRCRRQVAGTCFDLRYERPTPTRHRLEVRLRQSPPPGYQLSLGIRTPPGRRIRSATINRRPLPADAWTYAPGCAPDVPGTAWTTTPFVEDVDLEVES